MSILAGIVLAGGLSSRMGTDKSFLTFPNSQQTLLERVQKQLSLLCAPHVYVSGTQHKEGIHDLVKNCGPLAGIYSSLSYLAAHHPNVTDVVFAAVDMPNIQVDTYRQLVVHGQQQQRLCCFENSYLPLYIPASLTIKEYLAEQLRTSPISQIGTAKKSPNYSIKKMFNVLGGIKAPMAKNSQLDNINTPIQWRQHCNDKQS